MTELHYQLTWNVKERKFLMQISVVHRLQEGTGRYGEAEQYGGYIEKEDMETMLDGLNPINLRSMPRLEGDVSAFRKGNIVYFKAGAIAITVTEERYELFYRYLLKVYSSWLRYQRTRG